MNWAREAILRAARRWPGFGRWLWALGLDACPECTMRASEFAARRIADLDEMRGGFGHPVELMMFESRVSVLICGEFAREIRR